MASKSSRERARGDRREHALSHEPTEQIAVIEEGRTALDVGEEDSPPALREHREHVLDRADPARMRCFHQQPRTTAEGQRRKLAVRKVERPRERNLGACEHRQGDAARLELAAKLRQRGGDCRRCRQRPVPADVRRRDDGVGSGGERGTREGDRGFDIDRPVVDAREGVEVQVDRDAPTLDDATANRSRGLDRQAAGGASRASITGVAGSPPLRSVAATCTR